jgi:putative transposase
MLRDTEASGLQIREFCRKQNITEQTFFRWRNKYGGLDVPDSPRLKHLESENAKLIRLVADSF